MTLPSDRLIRGDALPASLREALRIEYRRTFDFPFETLTTLGFNAFLVIVGWFFMPPFIVDAMFSNHRPMAFAVVLAIWMYSDVPSTNQAGSDSVRFVAALDRPQVLARMLWARRIAVWTIATPICIVASIWLGRAQHNMTAAMFGLVWIVVAPIGVLSIAPLFGIRFPYHPMPLRERWSKRADRRRMVIRWVILIVAPYAWVPLIGYVMTLPALLIWDVSWSGTFPSDLSPVRFAIGTLVGFFSVGVGAMFGRRMTARLIATRASDLRRELLDPDLG